MKRILLSLTCIHATLEPHVEKRKRVSRRDQLAVDAAGNDVLIAR